MGLVRIDKGAPDLGEIPNLHLHPAAKQIGVIGTLLWIGSRQTWITDPGQDQRCRIFVGEEVPLQSVE